ncbi:hypothetical Protein YC6258_02968 [Gynuella sunshinyii YC6258]|uniref:Uncharacterized protein n=1 Tax=Gynuella sunshinyii YC6258 TaxID=1445510 RepID=A0A0C5VL15_9GAMM|nr:hypothetical Protein YC6258_02968 [Gynuella sunshinyii YC6258]
MLWYLYQGAGAADTDVLRNRIVVVKNAPRKADAIFIVTNLLLLNVMLLDF